MEDSEDLINDIDILIDSADKDIKDIENDLKPEIINAKQKKEKDKLSALKQSIIMLIATKNRKEATETIVREYLKNNHVFTIRDDEKEEVWIYHEGIYVPQGKTYIKEFCRELLSEAYTPNICNEVISKIEVETFIEQDDFFIVEDLNKLPVQNGILDLMTKKLEPFSPKYKFFNKLPVVFDPEKKCPMIMLHLHNVLKDEKDILVMQEIAGFLLYRDYKIEKAVLMIGDGRNGKSKTVELFKRFIGLDNCVSISLQQLESEDTFIISELQNKMANLGADMSYHYFKEAGMFKKLTGHDMVTANRKFKTPTHFVNYAKMIFCTNEPPRLGDAGKAFFNRWIMIDFPYTFISQHEIDKMCDDDKKNPNIKVADTEIINKISQPDELSGLLNWALDGLHRMLEKKDFSESKSTEEIKNIWIRKSDSFFSFVSDCCELGDDFSCTKLEMRKFYNLYCKVHKLRVLGDKGMKSKLATEFGVQDDRISINGRQEHAWIGIKVKGEYMASHDSKGCYGISITLGILNPLEISKKVATPTTLANYQSPSSPLAPLETEVIYESIQEGLSELSQHLDKAYKTKHISENIVSKIDIMIDIIRDIQSKNGSYAAIEDIIKIAISKGISQEDADSILAELRTRGDIFETKPGFVSTL